MVSVRRFVHHDDVLFSTPDSNNARSMGVFVEEADLIARKIVSGGSKGDQLNGTGGNDKIDGKGGDDTIDGRGGDDKLLGGDGKDKILGGGGKDKIDGGSGDDQLSGGAGDDQLSGGAGVNKISGGAGNDTAAFTGGLASFQAIYDDNGSLTIFKAGNEATFDKTVELLKFGSDIIDRRVVSAPVVISVTSANGELAPGATTVDTTLLINGTSDPFARIVVKDTDVQIGVTVADANGNWSFDNTISVLSDGPHLFSAVASYGAGLPTAAGEGETFTISHVVDLATLSGSQGVTIKGGAGGDYAGYSVSSTGDVNGDGFDDVIVGATGHDAGADYAGGAYVIFGSASGFGTDVSGGPILDLATLTAGRGFFIQGDGAGDRAGFSVSSAGDVNGDGLDDLIVGAPFGDDGGDRAGEAYVVFGTASGFGVNVSGRQVIDLTTLTTGQGFVIRGDDANDQTGHSVASAGDVNGDGFDDMIIGAYGGGDAGQAYVLFGTSSGFGSNVDSRQVIDLSLLPVSQGFVVEGDAANDYAGFSVASAGDVNGDGFDDVIVGASRGDDGGYNAGEAYVIFGTASGFGAEDSGRQVLDLAGLSASQGFIIQGDVDRDEAGVSVSSAGDIDGDGFDDLFVGASRGDDGGNYAGEAYVVFGTDSGFGNNVAGRHVIDLTTLSASQGFIIQGDVDGDFAGGSVSSAGDVNGDGVNDVIVGAANGDGGGENAGEAYVIFGTESGFGTNVSGRQVLDLTTLSASQGFIIQGDAIDPRSGISVSSAGDVNGDGFDDIIVGSPYAVGDGNRAGEAYILYGGTFGSNTQAINLTGSASAEILMGNAGDDHLTGNGGADVFRSGAGNDQILVKDGSVRLIDAGGGNQDTVFFAGSGFTFDARAFSNSELLGIEAFNLAQGNNKLILAASDMFHFSNTGNGQFTAAGSHNSLVVDGDSSDSLQLFNTGAADADWEKVQFNRQLDGTAEGDYTFVNLVENGTGRVLASIAVDQDVNVLL